MLKARKSRWFEKIFAVYNKNLLRRRFSAFRVCGLENLDFRKTSLPFLIYANHSSWWDGLAAQRIWTIAGSDGYVMMEEKQLVNFPLFQRLGAFSVVREKPREALESVNYAAQILKADSRKSVWLFPQGEILPNDGRPLKFYHGLAHIVRKSGNCATIPLAMRFEFLGDFKPEIFIKIGDADSFSSENSLSTKNLTAAFAEKLTRALDELKNDIIEKNFAEYQNIL